MHRKQVDGALAYHSKGDYDGFVDAADGIGEDYPHRTAYLALALASSEGYAEDAAETLESYKTDKPDPVALLAYGRLQRASPSVAAGFLYAYRSVGGNLGLLHGPESDLLKGVDDGTLVPGSGAGSSGKSAPVVAPRGQGGAKVEWERMKADIGASSAALDELMEKVGLEKLKAQALELYSKIRAEQNLPKAKRVPMTLNFIFQGNPGTGKVGPLYVLFLTPSMFRRLY